MVSYVDIFYGIVFGGKIIDGFLCMFNGFIGFWNGEIVSEFKFDNYYLLVNGVELY